MSESVFLILANKQDLPNAINAAELTNRLDLHSLRQRHWYLQSTSITCSEGIFDGLNWLWCKMEQTASFRIRQIRLDQSYSNRTAEYCTLLLLSPLFKASRNSAGNNRGASWK